MHNPPNYCPKPTKPSLKASIVKRLHEMNYSKMWCTLVMDR